MSKLILYKHNPVLDKLVPTVVKQMSLSYDLTGGSYYKICTEGTNFVTCEELTETVVNSLYRLKRWKLSGKDFSYGVIDGDVDTHLQNISKDIELMKKYGVWSYRVENIINEHETKKEEQKKKISMLSKQEQEQVKQVRLQQLLEYDFSL